MRPFHICLQGLPSGARPAARQDIDGVPVTSLDVDAEGGFRPLAVSFEQAVANLEREAGVLIEPDGSLSWVAAGGRAWRAEGNLFDRDGRVVYLELKGTLPPEIFDRLAAALGAAQIPLVVQFMRQAVYVEAGEFRRWLEAEAVR